MGAFVYKTGGLVHLLLFLAIISAIQGVIICPRTAKA